MFVPFLTFGEHCPEYRMSLHPQNPMPTPVDQRGHAEEAELIYMMLPPCVNPLQDLSVQYPSTPL